MKTLGKNNHEIEDVRPRGLLVITVTQNATNVVIPESGDHNKWPVEI